MVLKINIPLPQENGIAAGLGSIGRGYDAHAFGPTSVPVPQLRPQGQAAGLAQIGKAQPSAIDAAVSAALGETRSADLLAGLAAFNQSAPGTQPGSRAPVLSPGENTGRAQNFGYAAHVPMDLVFTESSGRWDAENKDRNGNRYVGQLQFGDARLADAIKAGVVPSSTTLDDVKYSPDLQRALGNWHFQDYAKRIKANGLDSYIGQTINGTTLTMNSLLAMAHLGGFTGMTDYLATNGRANPNDGITSLSDYAKTHAN